MTDSNEWIAHTGGERPVTPDTVVVVRMRPDEADSKASRKLGYVEFAACPVPAETLDWDHNGECGDIIAYRVVSQ